MVKPAAEVAAQGADHAHCDMMAAEADDAGMPSPDDQNDGVCCCPAVLTGLPATPTPAKAAAPYAAPMAFPLTLSAASRTLIPEPPPPKA